MKSLVRLICIVAIIITTLSISYTLHMFSLFNNVSNDADKLSEYVASQSKSITLKGIGMFGDHEITTNTALDSINKVLKPHIEIGGVVYGDYDPDNFHKPNDSDFSIEELSILAHNGLLTNMIRQNNSTGLKEIETIYYNSHLTNPDDLKEQSLSRSILSAFALAAWSLLSYFIFKATKSELYNIDYLFIRYEWTDNSSIIGRKILSILLNIILFTAFFATIISPLTIDSYNYEYSSSNFNGALGVLTGSIFIIISAWVLTSLGWWIFGKKSIS